MTELERILVVDDDPFQVKLLVHQLGTLWSGSVNSFLSGMEALDCLDSGAAGNSLILLDLNMPEMDGVEFVRQLVTRKYTGALALMSGEDSRILETTVKLARARGLNVLGQLDKPVRPEVLGTLLSRWRTHNLQMPRIARQSYGPDEIQRAIARGELFNIYQPKVHLGTGEVVGVETLVRWRHPEDGVVYPDQFIATAEEHDLMDGLTSQVLLSALEQARQWQDRRFPCRIAVNVSMENLTELDFPDIVLNAIQASGISPADLILEVTESRLMADPLTPLDVLTRLRLKQVRLAIDDFGTGHSSLAKLRDIPFDELKIDRGFVHGASGNATLRTIFDASIAMARQLGLTVVAEGVEDREDWEFLRARGCDIAQGYYVAKPMPASEFDAWITQWKLRFNELTPL